MDDGKEVALEWISLQAKAERGVPAPARNPVKNPSGTWNPRPAGMETEGTSWLESSPFAKKKYTLSRVFFIHGILCLQHKYASIVIFYSSLTLLYILC
jgi:hypothetical protein